MRPPLGVVKARDQTEHRRFAGTGWPDNADDLTGLDLERNIPQHLCLIVVAKGDVLECDCALDPARIGGVRVFANDFVGRQDFLDALERDRRLRNRAGHACEVLHRFEELRKVGEIDRQRAGGHRSCDDQRRSLPQHDRRADRDHDADHGRQQRLDLPGLEGGLDCGVAGRFEMGDFQVLASECLYRSNRSQPLLNDGDDLALPGPNHPRDFLHSLLEMHDRHQQEGRDGEGNQGEVPIEPEHQADHEDDGDDVDDDAQRRRRGKALDRRNVAGDGRHQRAGLRRIVESQRKPMEMLVNANPQIVGDPLPNACRVVIVDIGRDRADNRDDQRGDAGEQRDAKRVASKAVVVRPLQPMRQVVLSERIVEHEL